MSKKKDSLSEQFKEILCSMADRHDAWNIWSDFLLMSACAISNQVDKMNFEKRESMYMNACRKYSKEDRYRIKDLYWLTFYALCRNQEQDFLGRLSEELNLNNTNAKQYYSPYSIGKSLSGLVSGVVDHVAKKGHASVLDCTCGTGGLLVAFANEMTKRGVLYPTSIQFVAQDISYPASMACYIQLSMLHCPGFVVVGDALSHPAGTGDTLKNAWYTPMYFHEIWRDRRRWHYLDQFINIRMGYSE